MVKTVHVYCKECGRSEGYEAAYMARGDGWSDIDAESAAGAYSAEYSGLCSECRTT